MRSGSGARAVGSDRHNGYMPDNPALVLIVGDEELLVARAVAAAITTASAAATGGGTDLGGPMTTRVRAGDIDNGELAELLAPSMFGEDRIVVVEDAAEAGKEPAALIAATAGDLPEGVSLIVVHSGGGRARSMVGALTKLGATVVQCPKIRYPNERVAFVRAEFRALGARASDDVATLLVEVVGSDLRELASAVSQLLADSDGKVDVAQVHRYYAGRAEVTGFEIADLAMVGRTAAAIEALRWANHRGVAHVLIADALADGVHSVAKVIGLGRVPDKNRDAGELGMAPFKVGKVAGQSRHWGPDALARAQLVCAAVNAEVKGQSPAPEYALERAVRAVAELAKA